MKSEKQKEFLHQLSENQGIIHKICRIYTDNIHDHEDLFQEIVIQTWKSYSNYRGDAKFSTWIYKIGLNTALALFKKKNHKKEDNLKFSCVENLVCLLSEMANSLRVCHFFCMRFFLLYSTQPPNFLD